MREIRSSGSVEGVLSNRDPYSDWSSTRFFQSSNWMFCSTVRLARKGMGRRTITNQ
jgi:hypothetical protein